ncbi:lysylphosphatidylglycerol synthase domain-containing protein [Georgenia satyanarayanai]|uniref:lysylphosphatidylglycerol synthase domain-containing protein n=1 Tax=Georgenia satyanarayanai TaxID=860221 RepID=UPI00203E6033|nr:lysylphosphatidylglycerol synthase domain-containing protein [Georgenia satyanarayanai]MCM3661047.1 lysylphosphatidylglycerol synthase domain-containing protein [Georgenia satyanarayanai]
MSRILSALRSRWARGIFLLAALGFGVWAVSSQWTDVSAALASLSAGSIVAVLAISLVYVFLTMLSWRAVMTDLGSRLTVADASRVFFVSQVGKYLPGGVWNIVAAAEMGADHLIPRRRSVSVMVVSILVSIVTGLLLAVVAVLLGPSEIRDDYSWVVWTLPLFVVLLSPPVLNRVLGSALALVRRPPLEKPLSLAGIVRSSCWALGGWVLAGIQVWLIGTWLGMEPAVATLALAVGGYALAWIVGFLAIVVPAGVGVREAVLGALLAGQLGAGAVVVTVLLARVILTAADLLLGLGAMSLLRRRSRRSGVPQQ